MSHRVVFEFSEDVIRVCRSRRRAGGYVLTDCFSIPVPPEEGAAGQEIARCLKSRKWGPAVATLSLPRHEVMGRFLCLPSRDPGEIREMALLRLLRGASALRAHEIISDVRIVGRDAEGNSRVWIFVMQKACVLRPLRILQQADIVPERVTVSTQGALNWLFVSGVRNAFLLSGSAGAYDLSMVREGRCVFSRAFRPPGREGLAHEVKLNIDRCRRSFGAGADPCGDVYLSGEISIEQQEHLSDQLGRAVRRLPALEEYRDVVPSLRVRLNGTAAASSSLAGLALFRSNGSIDLTPPELRQRLRRRQVRRRQRLFVVGWGILLLTASVLLSREVSEDVRVLKKMRSASMVSASAEKEMRVMTQRLFWEDVVLRNRSPRQMWDWFYGHVPEKVALTRLDIKNGQGVSVEGRSDDISSVVSLLTLLEDSGLFKRVRLDHLGKLSESSEVMFRISAASLRGR